MKKTGRLFGVWVLFLMFAASQPSWAGDITEKREKLRSAIQEGVFRLYDVPLEYYIQLEMWDEIGAIFRINNEIARSVSLPGRYYSRPYFIGNDMWVFENPVDGKGAIYKIRPDTLEIESKLEKPEFTSYEGGVRVIQGDTIVSGGHDTDKDVDAAVIWETKTQRVDTVKLHSGHYVCAAHIEDGILYIGSCGEAVEAWDFHTREYIGGYTTPQAESQMNWDDKECITSVTVIDDKLFGAGEKSVFIWDVESGVLLYRYKKALAASIDSIYQHYLFSYRGSRFAVQEIATGEILTDQSLDRPIEDLIVVSERLIDYYPGDLMIVSLRSNKGIFLYDLKNFNLLRGFDFHGKNLAVHQNAIYASDDETIYRYDIMHVAPEEYRSFLEKADLSKVDLSEETYRRLMKRIGQYPEAVRRLGVSKRFMDEKNLSLDYSFKYLNIADDREPAEQDRVYGYKAFFEITNTSGDYYYVSLVCAWSGAYGAGDQEQMDASSARSQSFFIPPDGGTYAGGIVVGKKEPVHILFYPTNVRTVTQKYYEGFKRAVSPENTDTGIIDKYLADDLVKSRHDQLRRRKAEIAKNAKGFWLFNIFR